MDRFHTLIIADAATVVTGKGFHDLVVSGARIIIEQRFSRHDDAGRTETALECGIVYKRLLQRIQLAGYRILQPLISGFATAVAVRWRITR